MSTHGVSVAFTGVLNYDELYEVITGPKIRVARSFFIGAIRPRNFKTIITDKL